MNSPPAPKALLVDDDPALRFVVQAALSDAGFQVDTAENGAVALSLAATNPPEVIILDSQMPVLDGVRFARAYRRSTPSPAPIVAMSGRHDASLFAALIGAAAYLNKPVTMNELVATARRVLGLPAPET